MKIEYWRLNLFQLHRVDEHHHSRQFDRTEQGIYELQKLVHSFLLGDAVVGEKALLNSEKAGLVAIENP